MARKLASAHDLSSDQVVISREDFEALQGGLYELESALEDVANDIDLARGAGEAPDFQAALDWLVRVARPVAGLHPRLIAG